MPEIKTNTTELVEAKAPFIEFLENPEVRPNAILVRKIDEMTFPFADNTFFKYRPAQLAAEEFNRCATMYRERANGQGPMDAMRLMQNLILLESTHRRELVELAINIVREMYNVPKELNLRAFIEDPNQEEDGDCFDDQKAEPLSDEKKLELQPHIEKRRILNDIVHGAAIAQWTSAYYIGMDKLKDINPDLIEKYDRLSALVNFFNWQIVQADMMQMGGAPMVQGYNKVDVEKKEVKATAMNFPVLIHELSKGVLDYLTQVGIPNLPAKELEYVYAEADKYSHEQWHYFFGPSLWRAMLNTAGVQSQMLPPIVSHMAQMDYLDLSNLCIDICFHPEELGKKAMDSIKKQAY